MLSRVRLLRILSRPQGLPHRAAWLALRVLARQLVRGADPRVRLRVGVAQFGEPSAQFSRLGFDLARLRFDVGQLRSTDRQIRRHLDQGCAQRASQRRRRPAARRRRGRAEPLQQRAHAQIEN